VEFCTLDAIPEKGFTMPQVQEGDFASDASGERRVGHDRRQLVQLRIARFLNASASSRGEVELQGMGETGDPISIALPVETAMTLLNALHRLSTEDRWFDVV
jgi:hypothetical protein